MSDTDWTRSRRGYTRKCNTRCTCGYGIVVCTECVLLTRAEGSGAIHSWRDTSICQFSQRARSAPVQRVSQRTNAGVAKSDTTTHAQQRNAQGCVCVTVLHRSANVACPLWWPYVAAQDALQQQAPVRRATARSSKTMLLLGVSQDVMPGVPDGADALVLDATAASDDESSDANYNQRLSIDGAKRPPATTRTPDAQKNAVSVGALVSKRCSLAPNWSHFTAAQAHYNKLQRCHTHREHYQFCSTRLSCQRDQ